MVDVEVSSLSLSAVMADVDVCCLSLSMLTFENSGEITTDLSSIVSLLLFVVNIVVVFVVVVIGLSIATDGG